MSAHEGSKYQEKRETKKPLKICNECKGTGLILKDYSSHVKRKCHVCNGKLFI